MTLWNPFPHPGAYAFDAASLANNWARLHRGDCEPLPHDAEVLKAWVLFHNGEFQKATEAGLQAGDLGITVASKATCTYANYLENKEKTRLDLFLQAAQRAEAQQAVNPNNPNAWYWQKNQGRAGADDQAVPPACRCAHCAGRLSCRGD